MNANESLCSCLNCPGAACTCGCNTAAHATPATCACERACGCASAEAGCLCR
jgi:hypothetical protein